LRETNGWMIDPTRETAEAVRLARRAIEVGNGDAVARCYAGLCSRLCRIRTRMRGGHFPASYSA
jgi:hypothetical protein